MTKKPKIAQSTSRPRPDFSINAENVKEEYLHIPSHIATANEALADASAAASRAKANRDQVYSEIYLEIKEDAGEGRGPTEGTVKARILTDKRYQDAVAIYIQAEKKKAQFMGDLEGLRTKKDMVVSYGAHVRAELGHGGGGHAGEGAEDDAEEVDEDDE